MINVILSADKELLSMIKLEKISNETNDNIFAFGDIMIFNNYLIF